MVNTPTMVTIAAAASAPLYAAVGLNSNAGAALALGVLRSIAEDTLGSSFHWGESGKEREVPVVRIAIAEWA